MLSILIAVIRHLVALANVGAQSTSPLDRQQHAIFSRRMLQQASNSTHTYQITPVNTPEEFLYAVSVGARHIRIQRHLDMTGQALITPQESALTRATSLLGVLPPEVETISGNCAEAPNLELGIQPNHSPLRTMRQGQCLIAVDHSLLVVRDSSLWMHQLYIRLTSPRNGTFFEMVYVQGTGPTNQGETAAVIFSNVTMQGNGDSVPDCLDCAVTAYLNSAVYAEDSLFADFDGIRGTGVYAGATANFKRCEWYNNTFIDSRGDAAVIFANGEDRDDYDGYDNDGDALVRLEGCMFNDNAPENTPELLADNSGGDPGKSFFYSDVAAFMVTKQAIGNGSARSEYVSTLPRPLSDAPHYFVDSSDVWLKKMNQELGFAPIPDPVSTSANASASSITGQRLVVEEDEESDVIQEYSGESVSAAQIETPLRSGDGGLTERSSRIWLSLAVCLLLTVIDRRLA